MFEFIISAVSSLLTASVAGIFAWAFSINADVRVTESHVADLLTLINSRFDAQDDRLKRIERHVLNGTYRDDDH